MARARDRTVMEVRADGTSSALDRPAERTTHCETKAIHPLRTKGSDRPAQRRRRGVKRPQDRPDSGSKPKQPGQGDTPRQPRISGRTWWIIFGVLILFNLFFYG